MYLYDEWDEPTGPLMTCPNSKCPEEEFHAKTIREYQGQYPHGGMVEFIDDDGCPTCNTPGEEA